MSIDAQPNIPNRINPVESAEDSSRRQIEATLATLDAQFGAADVNAALQSIFVGDEAVAAIPASLSHLKWKLGEMNANLGEEAVTAALYETDKKRNPPIEQEPEPVKDDPELIRESDSIVGQMDAILRDLSENHADAFEIWGGEDELMELGEMPIYGSVEQTEALREELARLNSFVLVADDAMLEAENRIKKLKEIKASS